MLPLLRRSTIIIRWGCRHQSFLTGSPFALSCCDSGQLKKMFPVVLMHNHHFSGPLRPNHPCCASHGSYMQRGPTSSRTLRVDAGQILLGLKSASWISVAEGDGEEGEDGGADEDCGAEFKPLVQLDEVEVQVGAHLLPSSEQTL